MKQRTSLIFATLVLIVPTLAWATQPNARPNLSKQDQQTIQAMSAASTWGHPDIYGQFAGMEEYAKGDYKDAIRYFKYGAKYADKLSQLSIGLMYLNGRGVKQDPATAWAWLAIAAERDYPQFVATRDRVWTQLDAQQRARAKAIHKKLAAQYGDKVAKPRMRHELMYWSTQITGSHTGYNSGVRHVSKSRWSPGGGAGGGCARKTIEGAPISGCGGNYYAKWRWDPKRYFAVKDARWKGTVSVGGLKQVSGADKGKQDNETDSSGK